MKWNKNKIVSDLKKLIGTKGIIEEEQNPEGGSYCRDIYLSIKMKKMTPYPSLDLI